MVFANITHHRARQLDQALQRRIPPLITRIQTTRNFRANLLHQPQPEHSLKSRLLNGEQYTLLLPYLFYLLVGMIWFYLQHGYVGMSWLAGLAVYTVINCVMLLGVSCANIDAIDSEIKGRALGCVLN